MTPTVWATALSTSALLYLRFCSIFFCTFPTRVVTALLFGNLRAFCLAVGLAAPSGPSLSAIMTDAFGDDDFFKDYPPTTTGAAAPSDAGASAPAVGVPDDADVFAMPPPPPPEDGHGGGGGGGGDSNPFGDAADFLGVGTAAPAAASADGGSSGALGGGAFVMGGDGAAMNGANGGADGDRDDGGDGGDGEDAREELPPRPSTPTAVSAWRREHAARLEERAAREATVVAERRAAATDALASLHAKWGDRCARNAEGNKEFEATFLRERDGLIAQFSKPGEPPAWHVVPSLVDMSGKYKEGARDTSRMRSVLMKMKTK